MVNLMNGFKIEGNEIWGLKFRSTKIQKFEKFLSLGVYLRGGRRDCVEENENKVKDNFVLKNIKFVLLCYLECGAH